MFDPYHWQGFDFLFLGVAQDIVGALQVHMVIVLVGTRNIKVLILVTASTDRSITNCSPRVVMWLLLPNVRLFSMFFRLLMTNRYLHQKVETGDAVFKKSREDDNEKCPGGKPICYVTNLIP